MSVKSSASTNSAPELNRDRAPGLVRANIRAARSTIRAWFDEDHFVCTAVVVWMLVQLVAVPWDLPGAWSWENDAVAPRDFFAGIGYNLIPGKAHNYPLFHNLLLGVACALWLLIAVLWAGLSGGFDGQSIYTFIIATPTMTTCALTAKLVTLLMSALTLVVLARLTRRLFDRSAGRWAALTAMTCLSICYYGRTSNLDMPYLMWTGLAVDRLVTIIERGDVRDYRLFGLFVGAAVATKDQAYASFTLLGPVVLLLWPAMVRGALAAKAAHWRRLGSGVLAGLLSLGVLGGGLLNPTGFIARLELLTGPNSGDWRVYEVSLDGLVAQIGNLAQHQADYWWPWPVVLLAWIGVGVALAPGGSRPRLMRAIPLLAAIGFLVGFTLVVGRDEHRFMLPVGMFSSCYVGVAVAASIRRFGKPAQFLASGLLVFAGLSTLQLHFTQWSDARREVAAYLDTLPPGSVVETYGLTVTQPHFDVSDDSTYRCRRIGPKPPSKRNPLSGCEEVEGAWEDAPQRQPTAIVLTHWTGRFLPPEEGTRRTSKAMRGAQQDEDARAFFRAALADELPGYRTVLDVSSGPPRWAAALGMRRITIHGSTGVTLRVLRRVEM